MATIGDPADGQFQAVRAARLDALLGVLLAPGWEFASNMKSGEPRLLADEIVRLRDALAAARAEVEDWRRAHQRACDARDDHHRRETAEAWRRDAAERERDAATRERMREVRRLDWYMAAAYAFTVSQTRDTLPGSRDGIDAEMARGQTVRAAADGWSPMSTPAPISDTPAGSATADDTAARETGDPSPDLRRRFAALAHALDAVAAGVVDARSGSERERLAGVLRTWAGKARAAAGEAGA